MKSSCQNDPHVNQRKTKKQEVARRHDVCLLELRWHDHSSERHVNLSGTDRRCVRSISFTRTKIYSRSLLDRTLPFPPPTGKIFRNITIDSATSAPGLNNWARLEEYITNYVSFWKWYQREEYYTGLPPLPLPIQPTPVQSRTPETLSSHLPADGFKHKAQAQRWEGDREMKRGRKNGGDNQRRGK